MTFTSKPGYYLMRPGKRLPPIEYRRTHGVTGLYYKLGHYAPNIESILLGALGPLAGALPLAHNCAVLFFPRTYSIFPI